MGRLRDMLVRHEGMALKPYRDSVGKLTIGVGRCLDTNGITEEEALILFGHDLHKSIARAYEFLWFNGLSEARQDVIVSMIFNLGLDGFKKFKRTIEAVESGDFHEASQEMLRSKWATQVGPRATELANMMRTGEYQG